MHLCYRVYMAMCLFMQGIKWPAWAPQSCNEAHSAHSIELDLCTQSVSYIFALLWFDMKFYSKLKPHKKYYSIIMHSQ